MHNRSVITKTTAPHFQFGAIILFVVISVILMISLRLDNWSDFFILTDKFKKVRLEKLIIVGTAITVPIVVWCLTSWTAMRNQIRQHSMNVLLQTRTSATYQEHSEVAASALRGSANLSEPEVKKSVIYILNFLEFVAIGIKRCDLDEEIFKDAWKGIINSTVEHHQDGLIKEARLGNKKVYETLIWLNERWQKPKKWYENICLQILCAVVYIFGWSFLILVFLKLISVILI